MNPPKPDVAALSNAISRLGRGDDTALLEIYRATCAKLFGITLRILGDRSEAEDALQDVYVNLWQHAARYDSARASPVSWLAVLARNRAIDRLRRLNAQGAKTRAPIEAADAVPDPAPSAEVSLILTGETQQLQRCIDMLENRTREAIRDAWFVGLSYPELAERANVPLGTVKSWVRRGLVRLKACLEQ